MSETGGPKGKDYCILYNPQWAHLPLDLSKAVSTGQRGSPLPTQGLVCLACCPPSTPPLGLPRASGGRVLQRAVEDGRRACARPHLWGSPDALLSALASLLPEGLRVPSSWLGGWNEGQHSRPHLVLFVTGSREAGRVPEHTPPCIPLSSALCLGWVCTHACARACVCARVCGAETTWA